MNELHLQPTLHLQDRRKGNWGIRFSKRGPLSAIQAQMVVIDGYRGGNWPQRITDDLGNVLVQNEAARLLFMG